MPAIINSDSGITSGSAGLKIYGNSDGILEIQNNGVTSLVVANNYIRVPVGDTASRPDAASVGMFRFNNQLNVFESYNGTSWGSGAVVFNAEYLTVGGGGSGGGNPAAPYGGGGAGGGGFVTSTANITVGAPYLIQIGAGSAVNGSTGGNTIFSSSISYGGGPGTGGGGDPAPGQPGSSGGGGGCAISGTDPANNQGAGIPGQGYPGGAGAYRNGNNPTAIAGGGGGAGQAGVPGFSVSLPAGKGGDGQPSLITGANVIYGGGGGGGGLAPGTRNGGAGGGGPTSTNASVNSGGGGGGRLGAGVGGTGGSGVVILAHSNTVSNAFVSAGLTYTTDSVSRPGFLIYTFTAGLGTVTWN